MIFLALIFFIILIVVHEYGHFLVAKRNGVEVEEFGIGFPPKIAGRTMGRGIFRSYYTINWLPLGGFVRLKGENDSDKTKGSFGATTFWVKTKIILAGVFMNFLIAVLMFTVLAMTSIPTLIQDQYSRDSATVLKDYVAVGFVNEGSPAEAIGLEVGDEIVAINQTKITSTDELFETTEAFAGQEVALTYVREGEEFTATTQLNSVESEEPFLGVGPAQIETKRYGFFDAVMVGWGTTIQLGEETYKGLGRLVGDLFSRDFESASEQVSGPVGVFVILDNASTFGMEYLLFFIGVISLTLAIMNALPIPALDGGRLFVSGLFKLIRKPLSKDVENRIHGTGFAVLMFLIVLISIVDVQRFF